jgi:hypothetical protein
MKQRIVEIHLTILPKYSIILCSGERKMSPNAVFSVILCAYSTFWLAACIKPVSLGGFLENDIIQAIIEEGREKNKTEGLEPVLETRDSAGVKRAVPADDMVYVFLSSGDVTIRVTNVAEYDTIEWHNDFSIIKSGAILTVGSSLGAFFPLEGVYVVTAIGVTEEGTRYSTLFYIKVES